MRRRDSDLLSLMRPPPSSYSYSQCSGRSRSGSFESDALVSELDGSELLDVDDLQELGETVRVTVRFRPLLAKEEKSGHSSVWTVHTDTGTVETAGPNARRRGVYAFDEVYDAQHSTRAIYDGLARSIARSALDGIHGSIFAYGQTSSGKTHTMQGTAVRHTRTLEKETRVETEQDRRPQESDGLVQLAVKDLFDEMARRSDVEYLVRVSYLEVYNETVKDLLVTGDRKRRNSTVQIREHPVTGVFTDNSERVVTDARGVLQALKDGEKQRAVGVTRMNERSSRSHSIFRVVIESKTRLECPVPNEDEAMELVRVGCLNFVDLAGSESARAVSSGGKRLSTESGNINRSLLALSRVVVALGSKLSNQDHVNFRDSKLTRILQPSLSGAARVLFVCCASSAAAYVDDTRSTLKFASRAKRIKVNASVNEVVDQRARALMEIARENHVLRQQLEALAAASRNEMDAMEEHAARLRLRIVSMEAAAAAPAWVSSAVVAPVISSEKSRQARQPEVTGLEGAYSPIDSNNQVLNLDLSDEEETDVESQFSSPTEPSLLMADAACPTCETLDDALEIAKTRELDSFLRIGALEQEIAQLHRQNEEGSTSANDFATESQCVLDVDDNVDETEGLTDNEDGSIVHGSSLSLACAALLAVVVESLTNRSPTEALAIVVIAGTCMGIMLASFAWNVAAVTL